MVSILVLCLAGFAAGALNAVAGGGTFLTFPALVWLGVPPVMANATATVTALPGYIGSAWGFRHEVRAEGALSLRAMLALSVAGGLAGAFLLTVTSDDGLRSDRSVVAPCGHASLRIRATSHPASGRRRLRVYNVRHDHRLTGTP